MESLFDNGQPIRWQSDVGNWDKEGRLFNILTVYVNIHQLRRDQTIKAAGFRSLTSM